MHVDSNAIENKKRYLKRYKKATERLAMMESRLAEIDATIGSVRSPQITGMPRGGVPRTIEDKVSDKMELESRVDALRVRCSTLRTETLQEIDRLDDSRYADVLECLFLQGIDLYDTADQLGYSSRQIQRLYAEAIVELIRTE